MEPKFAPALRRVAAACLLAVAGAPAHAEDLGSGTLTVDSRTITVVAGPYSSSNPTGFTAVEGTDTPLDGQGGLVCDAQWRCDDYALQLDLPADFATRFANDTLRITASWSDAAATAGAASATDIDVFLFDASGNEASGNAGATTGNPEVIELRPAPGQTSYNLRLVPFLVNPGLTVTLTLELREGPTVISTGPVTLGGPTFQNYAPPSGLTTYSADEPTLHVNHNTNHAFMLFRYDTLKAVFDDSSAPATVTWSNVADPYAVTSADPFMVGDEHPMANGLPNPRIWVTQLAGAGSTIAYSDDEGATWTPSFAGGQPHGADNQSIAAGPYPEGKRPLTASYDHAFYYCSHAAVNAFCSRSDDGGRTFNPSRPIFEAADLCGNHGHVKVGPDGTVYVPMNNTCQGAEGVSISVDAGETWHYVKVPGTTRGRWDSSIAIANDGRTLWYAYGEEGDDRPRIAKGRLDKSDPNNPTIAWLGDFEVGAPAGLTNIVFPAMVAGDPDRAAVAFHGTTFEGNSGSDDEMVGAEWHLYVATTFDGGATWQLRDVTPVDPTQRNAICDAGTVCADEEVRGERPPDRNLLDFMDMVIDGEGRLVVGYADGCTGGCALPGGAANYAAAGVIARQTGGKRMFAAFDPVEDGVPARPAVTAVRTLDRVVLDWVEPATNGSAITEYVVQRAENGSPVFRELARVTFRRFNDHTAIDPTVAYSYRVAAVNADGQGDFSDIVTPALPTENLCTAPGLTIYTDPTGDVNATAVNGLPADAGLPSMDIERLSISQPHFADGVHRLVFQLEVADLSGPLPLDTAWFVSFHTEGDKVFVVRMYNNVQGQLLFQTYESEAGNIGANRGDFPLAGTIKPAEPTSAYTPAGVITIVARAENIGIAAPGEAINGLLAVTTKYSGSGGNGLSSPSDLAPDSGTGSARFETVAPLFCAPNAPPVADLAVDRTAGARPLTVRFDGSASFDTDATDTVATWVFDFGDGTPPVASGLPVVLHTYTEPGTFGARLRVVDSRGLPSGNEPIAQIVVESHDAVPNPFGFGELVDTATGAWIRSAPVVIRGLTGPAPIAVSAGSHYRIGDGAFTNQPGLVGPGERVFVRHRSAATPLTATETTLTIGGVAGVFRSTTGTADGTPDAFGFFRYTQVDPGVLVVSNPVRLAGFNVPVAVKAGAGQQIRIGDAPWTTGGTLAPGQVLRVRHHASTTAGGVVRSVVSVGGVTGSFVTRTK